MAFEFPSSTPADDATFDHSGWRYIWRGDRWDSIGYVGVDPNAGLFANVVSVAAFPASLGSQTNTTFFNQSPFSDGTGGIANDGEGFIGLRTTGIGESDGCPMILTDALFAAFDDNTTAFSGADDSNMNVYFNTTRAASRCRFNTGSGSFNAIFGDGTQSLMSGLSTTTSPQIDDMTTIERLEFKLQSGDNQDKALLLKPNYDDLLGSKEKNTNDDAYTENYYGYSWEISTDDFASV